MKINQQQYQPLSRNNINTSANHRQCQELQQQHQQHQQQQQQYRESFEGDTMNDKAKMMQLLVLLLSLRCQ